EPGCPTSRSSGSGATSTTRTCGPTAPSAAGSSSTAAPLSPTRRCSPNWPRQRPAVDLPAYSKTTAPSCRSTPGDVGDPQGVSMSKTTETAPNPLLPADGSTVVGHPDYTEPKPMSDEQVAAKGRVAVISTPPALLPPGTAGAEAALAAAAEAATATW